jgi:3-hydroxyisobutyrate dehydrogenase-like beta-hydroxyacid dehydrogenase
MKNDYSPQFPLRLMNKDFGLILNLAAAMGAQMPATRAASRLMQCNRSKEKSKTSPS